MSLKTASVIFVEEAILKGDLSIGPVLEVLTKRLTAIGYLVKKILVVEESDHVVLTELENFSKHYDIVLIVVNTKPTSVSKALANLSADELINNEKIHKKLCLEKHILWPKLLKYIENHNQMALYYQRMFILFRDHFEEQFNLIQTRLQEYTKERQLTKIFYLKDNARVQPFNHIPSLEMRFLQAKSRPTVILNSKHLKSIVDGEIKIQNQVESGITHCDLEIDMENDIWNSSEPHIKLTLEVITKCLDDYGPKNVFLSFNGGKDCTVLHHLIQIAMKKKYPELNHKLLCFYVQSDHSFMKQNEFIEQCRIYYNLEIINIKSEIKTALTDILKQRPNLKACFMGTRRTDPYSAELTTLKMTDPDWPQVMRCNPILDWHYADIWDYLLYYKVPYCELYDMGYTSLGSTLNTVPNPSLAYTVGDTVKYWPAYRLLKEKEERDGRNVSIVSKI